MYDRAGEPERGIVFAGVPGGARTAAHTEDPATTAGLVEQHPLGAKVELAGDGTFTL